jgi:hypothetical protein
VVLVGLAFDIQALGDLLEEVEVVPFPRFALLFPASRLQAMRLVHIRVAAVSLTIGSRVEDDSSAEAAAGSADFAESLNQVYHTAEQEADSDGLEAVARPANLVGGCFDTEQDAQEPEEVAVAAAAAAATPGPEEQYRVVAESVLVVNNQ